MKYTDCSNHGCAWCPPRIVRPHARVLKGGGGLQLLVGYRAGLQAQGSDAGG